VTWSSSTTAPPDERSVGTPPGDAIIGS
jgi:hypothetical protein